MKQMKRTLLAVSMLLSAVQLSATTSGLSYFLPRAQNGTAVDVLGWSPFINKYDADAMYFDFKVQSEWRQSFNSTKLGEYLCFNGTNSMTWGPARNGATNATTDVFSTNFLLPSGFSSEVTFNPKVQSSITDFSLFVGFDEFVAGLWASVHLPLVYTRWNTHIAETPITAVPAAGFAAGEIQNAALTTTPYANVIAAFVGNKTAGDDTTPWAYGRINGSQNETKVGDIALNLGYNFVSKENMYLGVAVRGLFGAGGHSKAQYVFEPTVGYGGRMGVGGMVDAGVRLWEKDEDHCLHAYFAGYAVHLFASKQYRSFDLTNSGIGSRYNLVKKLTVGAPSTYTSPGAIDNMINIGTQQAKIGINVAYEVDLQLTYQTGNIGLDLGYSVGGHGGEKFHSFVSSIPANTYVLYGFTGANALLANQLNSITAVTVAGDQTTGGAATAVTTTNEATYCISNAGTNGLNTASALAPSSFSNCIYGDINYTWRDNDWMPNVSLFANVDFGGSNKTISTWGVGLQGNVSY